MSKKLSKAQLDVLRLMADGWELGSFEGTSMNSHWNSIRKVGSIEKSTKVHGNTLDSLRRAGLIACKPREQKYWYRVLYALTAAGREAAQESAS